MNRAIEGKVANRLAAAHGHLAGVRQMVLVDKPCPQIIYQLRAVRSALVQVEEIMIKEHLRHCLQRTSLADAEGVIEEIAELWSYSPGRHGQSDVRPAAVDHKVARPVKTKARAR